MSEKYAEDIKWLIDEDDIYRVMMSRLSCDIANFIGEDSLRFEKLETEDQLEMLQYYLEMNPDEIYDFMKLPTEVAIPDDISWSDGDYEEVEDYLLDKYGYPAEVGYVYEKQCEEEAEK